MLSEDMNYLLFNFEIIPWNEIIRKDFGNMLSFFRKHSFKNHWKCLDFFLFENSKIYRS